jgi:membrane protease YdiL (CAAX protease family)
VATYFCLAYLLSWGLWLPLVASVQGWWNADVPGWWHYAGAAGPVTAAVVAAFATEGSDGVRSLLGHYSLRRARPPWLLFGLLSPLAVLALGLIAARLADGRWPTLDELSRTDNLPALALPLTLLVHTVTFGIGEETGWRGFALPRLQADRSAIGATHVLALGWGLWHLPTFFENPSFMDMAPVELFGWATGIWMGAVFLTWLYNSADGSLLVVVLWHGIFNQFSASEASSIVPAVMSIGVILVAIAAIRIAGPVELTGFSPRSGPRQQHGQSPITETGLSPRTMPEPEGDGG